MEINVVGAAFIKDGKVLALRRAGGIDSVIHKYEFVGGKLKEGETPQDALKRECFEELNAQISVGELCGKVKYQYPEFTVSLSVYICKLLSDYTLTEHEEAVWLDCNNLDATEWAPADAEILKSLKKGIVNVKLASPENYADIFKIAYGAIHSTYDEILSKAQADYILNKFYASGQTEENVKANGYKYYIVELNGEAAGFYYVCPTEEGDGTLFSKLYLYDYATGKGIVTKVVSALPKPLYIKVNKKNTKALDVYKNLGFKICQSVTCDIGKGYINDEYLMILPH